MSERRDLLVTFKKEAGGVLELGSRNKVLIKNVLYGAGLFEGFNVLSMSRKNGNLTVVRDASEDVRKELLAMPEVRNVKNFDTSFVKIHDTIKAKLNKFYFKEFL